MKENEKKPGNGGNVPMSGEKISAGPEETVRKNGACGGFDMQNAPTDAFSRNDGTSIETERADAGTESAPEAESLSDAERAPGAESVLAAGAESAGKKAKNPNRKKLIALIATTGAVLAILAAVLITGLVRNRRPPALEDIRARVEELVLASREVNEIFFGEGLPSYERIYVPDYTLGKYQTTYNGKEYNRSYYVFTDHEGRRMIKYQYCLAAGSDTDGDGKADRYEYPDLEFGGFLSVEYVNDYRYAEIFFEKTDDAFYEGETKNAAGETVPCFLVRRDGYTEPFYYTAEDDLYYDYVTEDCAYQSIDEIKALANTVYSAEYLASVYESIFTGITVSDRDTGTLLARYAEIEMEDGFLYLMKSNRTEPLNVKRVYDFSTMKMVKPSNSTYVTVEMETYLEGDETNRLAVRVALVFENGQWMLDSPTY